MKMLHDLIGEDILVNFIFTGGKKLEFVKLIALEPYGIWIESSHLTQAILNQLNVPAGNTPVVFVPFAQIVYVLSSSESVSLSNKAFGVSDS
jgi:hypothetical protein